MTQHYRLSPESLNLLQELQVCCNVSEAGGDDPVYHPFETGDKGFSTVHIAVAGQPIISRTRWFFSVPTTKYG